MAHTGAAKRLSTDERRAQLLAAGRRIFNERSYADVAVEQIARDAGVSTGLLYHYFPTKLDFFLACASAELDELVVRLAATSPAPGPQRLDAALDVYLDFISTERGGVRNALQLAGTHAEAAALVERLRSEVTAQVLDTLGVDSSPALRTAVVGFQGFAEAATLDWLARGDLDRAAFKSLLANCLAQSLAAAASLDQVKLPARVSRRPRRGSRTGRGQGSMPSQS